MAAGRHLRPPRRRSGVEGALVLAAVALVPVALVRAARAPVVPSLTVAVDVLVVLAGLAWVVVVLSFARAVARTVRDGAASVEPGLIGWAAVRVAALVLLLAPFLDGSASSRPAPPPTTTGTTALVPVASPVRLDPVLATPAAAPRRRGGHRRGAHAAAVPRDAGLLVALAADHRRRRRATSRTVLDDESAVDTETALLSSDAPPLPPLRAVARALAALGWLDAMQVVVLSAGQARIDARGWSFDPLEPQRDVQCLVVPLGEDADGLHVAVVPRGASLRLAGPGAGSLLADAMRVAPAVGLGLPVRTTAAEALRALALRDDGEVVVCVGAPPQDEALRSRFVGVDLDATDPVVVVREREVRLGGRVLHREVLGEALRELLDGRHDVALAAAPDDAPRGREDAGVLVRLLCAVPRVDGLQVPLEPGRERRGVELLAYLALRGGEPVTGERLRMRVLGPSSSDAAAQTLFNVASQVRRVLGEGPLGPRLPPAGRHGHYRLGGDVTCDVALLHARVEAARACEEPDERIAWLRAALELIEGEPFATVLDGYDWFLTEGHLARLQAAAEGAACELVELSLRRGYPALARFAIERARLVDPNSEAIAAAAAAVAAAGVQASLDAIAPALRSTEPSAPSTL